MGERWGRDREEIGKRWRREEEEMWKRENKRRIFDTKYKKLFKSA